jgi:D-tyrosyl-tRNA(Tyr) deacylase
MRVVIQRVSYASVRIEGHTKGAIQKGLLVLAGFEPNDVLQDIEWMSKKIASLRIFNDENGLMNWSVKDIQGEILVVSQFTLFASYKKGNRPSFIGAAKSDLAIPLYEKFIEILSNEIGKKVETGTFGADMKVELLNDGPVTIVMNSKLPE